MPTITSKGYKLPNKGEKVTWWQNLIDNWIRVNNHVHDGVDSQLIKASSVVKEFQDLPASGWESTGGAIQVPYSQLVSMPVGLAFDNTNIEIRLSTGEPAFLNLSKNSLNSFYIYSTDDTIDLKVIYG